jgi:hypothetical protein
MPIWSDLYSLVKPSHGQLIPPLQKGMKVTVHWKLKRPKDINYGGIAYFVKVVDVIGDDVVAKTVRQIDHIKKHELMIFDKSYILNIDGGWAYALQYQSVKVSKRVYYGGIKITDISGMSEYGPLDYGLKIYGEEDIDSHLKDEDWVMVSLPEMLAFAPELASVIKTRRTHELIGDLYLPIDVIERDDDQDEWQYHNNR